MVFTTKEGFVRVDFFRSSGKWYTTEHLDMSKCYNDPLIHDTIKNAIREQYPTYNDFDAVVLKPYHIHKHPILIKGERN